MADANLDKSTSAGRKRRRAVRLTDTALQSINSELSRRSGAQQRLTKELRAELMGVSLATSDKVLKQQGVDRSTLLLVFKNLALEWDETYCEAVPLPEQSEPEQIPEDVHPLPVEVRRQFPRIVWVGVGLSMLMALFLIRFAKEPSQPQVPASTRKASELIERAIQNYQVGNYATARKQLDEAVAISRSKQSAGHIATGLRVAGDIESAHGNLAQAKRLYELSLIQWQLLGVKNAEPPVLEALGVCKTELGEFDAARQDLTTAFTRFSESRDRPGMSMAARDLSTLCLALEDVAGAEEWISTASSVLEDLPETDLRMDISARKALVLSRQGKGREARNILADCLDHWVKKAHDRWIAVTQLQLATVEIESGNGQSGQDWLKRSRSGFTLVGDAQGVRRCNHYFATLSLRERS